MECGAGTVRLAGRFYTGGKRVVGIKLRITASNIPTGAEVHVTDVQLQAGEDHSGFAFAPEDIDIRPRGRYYVNGTINKSQPVMMLANMLKSSGMKLDILDAEGGAVQLGTYRFGPVLGEATADGEKHAATQGWGRVPIITERCDLQIIAKVEERIHVRAAWNDLRDGKDPRPPRDSGTVTKAHANWPSVLAEHPNWASVLAVHNDWK